MFSAFVGTHAPMAENLVYANDDFNGKVAILRENQGLYTGKDYLHPIGFGAYPNYWNNIPQHGGDLDITRYLNHLRMLQTHVNALPRYDYYCIDYESGSSGYPSFKDRLERLPIYRMFARHTIDMCNYLRQDNATRWGFYGDYIEIPNSVRYIPFYPSHVDLLKLKDHLYKVRQDVLMDGYDPYSTIFMLSSRYDTAWDGDNINHGKRITQSTADLIRSLVLKGAKTALFMDVPDTSVALKINEEWKLYS